VTVGGHPVDPFFIEIVCVFLVAFGSFALLGLFWNQISKWKWVAPLLVTAHDKAVAEQKAFNDLALEIREMRDRCIYYMSVYSGASINNNTYEVGAEITNMTVKLQKIGLGFPELNKEEDILTVIDRWRIYLSLLVPLSATSDLEKAKSITITPNTVRLEHDVLTLRRP